MKITYQETVTALSGTSAFAWGISALHNLLTSPECGIEHYQTDILHDIINITDDLAYYSYNKKGEPWEYRAVIGTRVCGTFDALTELEYWASSAIAFVGISIEKIIEDRGDKKVGRYTVTHVLLEHDEIEGFDKNGLKGE